MSFNTTLFLIGYITLFMAILCCAVWWDRRQRKTKPPFPEDLKLLRMPGEYLWHQWQKLEADIAIFFGTMIIPLVLATGVLLFAVHFKLPSLSAYIAASVAFTVALLLCVRWCHSRLQRRASEYLGFFGERHVAECLDPLKANGWYVFHDMQCVGATGKFNLDHIAVGPGGVWVVETKTRRKGRSRAGFKPHEVTFDGQKIVWPWGEDKNAIVQASENARWLRALLEKLTGKTFDVSAVVAVPGYCVVERSLGPVRVVNPKVLPQVLCGRGKTVLPPEDIDLIRRQVSEKCRDVEY